MLWHSSVWSAIIHHPFLRSIYRSIHRLLDWGQVLIMPVWPMCCMVHMSTPSGKRANLTFLDCTSWSSSFSRFIILDYTLGLMLIHTVIFYLIKMDWYAMSLSSYQLSQWFYFTAFERYTINFYIWWFTLCLVELLAAHPFSNAQFYVYPFKHWRGELDDYLLKNLDQHVSCLRGGTLSHRLSWKTPRKLVTGKPNWFSLS